VISTPEITTAKIRLLAGALDLLEGRGEVALELVHIDALRLQVLLESGRAGLAGGAGGLGGRVLCGRGSGGIGRGRGGVLQNLLDGALDRLIRIAVTVGIAESAGDGLLDLALQPVGAAAVMMMAVVSALGLPGGGLLGGSDDGRRGVAVGGGRRIVRHLLLLGIRIKARAEG
jgi:hypothetical protein